MDFSGDYFSIIKNNNEEILKMRKELHQKYTEILLKEYSEVDVEKSLLYFLVAPSSSHKNKTSLTALLECCEVAKTYRERKND